MPSPSCLTRLRTLLSTSLSRGAVALALLALTSWPVAPAGATELPDILEPLRTGRRSLVPLSAGPCAPTPAAPPRFQ